jgi:peptidoglycan-associated lipoprotein
MRSFRVLVLGLAGAASVSACATKGYVNRRVDTVVATERTAREGADSAQVRDIATLRTDLTALRNDLQTLRNEFGARITAMEDQVKFTMPVHFAFDDASVRQEDQAALQRFAQVANKYYNGAAITVEGFADPAGTTRYNAQLSKRRADSVKDFLVAQGLNDGLLKTVGMGESRQVRPGAAGTEPGAELNRRVVFVIESPGVGAATTAATTASMQ